MRKKNINQEDSDISSKNLKKSSKEEFNFADLVSGLKKINDDSFMLAECPYSKIENFIGLGNYLLNAQICGNIFGGIPEGRITVIAGPSGSGKTFVFLNAAREAQKQGYKIVWIDTENALDIEMTNRFQIDSSNFNLVSIGTINKMTEYVTNICDTLLEKKEAGIKIPKIMIIVDSLGNLSTDKETKDAQAGSDKVDYTKAKELRKFFRVITKKAGILKIPVGITNHVYDGMSLFPTNEMSGGGGAKYNASTILFLSTAKLKDKSDGPQTGIIVTSRIKKSRFTKAGIDIKFFINFLSGMNPYIGLENYIDWDLCGIGYGKIEKDIYIPDDSGKYIAVKHLGKHIKTRELFTSEIFTTEVLEKLQPVIQNTFEFKEQVDYLNDIDIILNTNTKDDND